MNTLTAKSLTIFFPVYNESANIEQLVLTALELAPTLSPDVEIIVVNDGSDDGSGELIDRLAKDHPAVRAVHHDVNRGYGAALRSGFAAATKEIVFYTDGDGQFDLQDITTLIPMMSDADVVSCFRIDRQDHWQRIINTRLFEWCIRMVFGLKVHDPDCAFKIYSRAVLNAIRMESEGAMIDVEMLLQAQRHGFRIVQPGVRHFPRSAGVSSGGNPRVILRAFREAYQLWRRLGSRFNPH